MKLSELTPCAICGGPIAPLFYRIRVEQMMVDANAANRYLALTTMFGGSSALANLFSDNDNGTLLLQENSVLICSDCAATRYIAEVLFTVDETQDAPA